MKGKVSDLCDASDSEAGSSAKKSLRFEGESPPADSLRKTILPTEAVNPEKENRKRWYEHTLEEEKQTIEMQSVQGEEDSRTRGS